MLFFAFIVVGFAVGIWRMVSAKRRGYPGLSEFFLPSVAGIGLAVGVFLLVSGVLPPSRFDESEVPLLDISSAVDSKTGPVFVAVSSSEDGKELRNFVVNRGEQTMFRNDLAIPSKMYVGSYTPHAVYTTSYVDYPLLSPVASLDGGYLGQTVELFVPTGGVLYDFHLDS